MTGSAKHHGKPISATVYTNSKVDDRIKIFYTDEPKNYIISFAEDDSSGMFKFFNINIKEKWIGSPVATPRNDYDFIAGHLFQSEKGAHFSPYKDNIKGSNFDPEF